MSDSSLPTMLFSEAEHAIRDRLLSLMIFSLEWQSSAANSDWHGVDRVHIGIIMRCSGHHFEQAIKGLETKTKDTTWYVSQLDHERAHIFSAAHAATLQIFLDLLLGPDLEKGALPIVAIRASAPLEVPYISPTWVLPQ